MKAIIFYLALMAMVFFGIAEVKKSLPIVRQELGIIENNLNDIKKALHY